MNCDQIRIQKIRVKDLYKFACQVFSEAKKGDVIPISKDRALAYANNPYADENDIGLIVAYAENKCLGYLGIMPGLLKVGDRFSRVHWFSTWYVPKKYRNMSVGAILLIDILSLKYDLVITGLSRASERILRGMRLQEIKPLIYCIINIYRINPLGFALYLIQKAINKLGLKQIVTNVLFRIPEYILSSSIKKVFYNSIFDYYKYKELNEEVSCQEVNTIDKIRIKQFEYNKTYPKFYRGEDVVNWMLQYKWIPECDKIENKNLSYYFSNIRNISKFIALNVYSPFGNNYKGYLILSVNSERLKTVIKVLDFWFYDQADLKYVLSLAIKHAKTYLADCIEFPASLRVYVKDDMLMKYLTQKKKRVYFYYPKDRNSPLAVSAENVSLNYCDGDTAFT